MPRSLKTEVGEVLHRAAAKFLAAEAAEVLAAETGDGGEFLQRPRAGEVGFHALPDAPETVVARSVGFESAFTFSNTFNKWIGWRPSEFRH